MSREELTFVVPTAENIVQRWPVASLEKTNDKSKSKQMGVGLGASKTECENCPPELKEWNPNWN